MKIVVLIKEVPDTYGDRKLDLETGLLDRAASEPVLDEIGERALEAAISYREANEGTEVVVLSMGPESAESSIRKGLAMGADHAVHVTDEGLRGADLTLSTEALAAALRKTGFDLVITGNVSTDGSAGMLPAMLAETLGAPCMTGLSRVEIEADRVRGTRPTDGATAQLSAELPAVISITEALPDPRYPTFKGIMAAKKKPLEKLSMVDLGLPVEDLSVPRSIMTTIAEKPPRQAGVKIVDEGDAGVCVADFLLSNGLA